MLRGKKESTTLRGRYPLRSVWKNVTRWVRSGSLEKPEQGHVTCPWQGTGAAEQGRRGGPAPHPGETAGTWRFVLRNPTQLCACPSDLLQRHVGQGPGGGDPLKPCPPPRRTEREVRPRDRRAEQTSSVGQHVLLWAVAFPVCVDHPVWGHASLRLKASHPPPPAR